MSPAELVPAFLGQDLMRSALESSRLKPFEAAAAVMVDDQYDVLTRANAFKAIRFGLSGLAIHGWQETITEPLTDKVPFGNSELGFKFVEGKHFPGHDYSLEESVFFYPDQSLTRRTQGEAALKTMYTGFQQSMRYYLSGDAYIRGKTKLVRRKGIPVRDVVDAMVHYVNLGRNAGDEKYDGLDTVPDAYRGSLSLPVDLFQRSNRIRTSEVTSEDIVRGISAVAANTVRFSQVPIVSIMNQYADTNKSSSGAEVTVPERDNSELPDLLADTIRHIMRLSQRQDGAFMVPDSERTQIHITTKRGKPTAVWYKSHAAVAPRAAGLDGPSNKDLELVQARNKCPIGYTPDAFQPPPMRKLGDAMLHYLVSNGLHDPTFFLLPKVISVPPAAREPQVF